MPITPTVVTQGSTGTNGISAATASVTPVANKIHLLWISTRSGTATVSSVAGCNLTWTQVTSLTNNAGDVRLTLYRGIGAAPTTGAITITMSVSVSNYCWSLEEWDGTKTSGVGGADAIAQYATAANASNAFSVNITMAAFQDAVQNALVSGFASKSGTQTFTPDAEHTVLGSVQLVAVELNTLGVQWKTGQDLSVSGTFGSSTVHCGIAVELAIEPPPPNLPEIGEASPGTLFMRGFN